ncbi:SART-1 family protein DOT2 [Pelomyxa schiedti]|nr:SART-1 family protein DOT2 [Pelomyxa schiedti]
MSQALGLHILSHTMKTWLHQFGAYAIITFFGCFEFKFISGIPAFMHAAKVPVEKHVEVSLPDSDWQDIFLLLSLVLDETKQGLPWHCIHHIVSADVEFPAEIFCLPAPCWPLRLDADAGADSGAALTSGGKARMGDEEDGCMLIAVIGLYDLLCPCASGLQLSWMKNEQRLRMFLLMAVLEQVLDCQPVLSLLSFIRFLANSKYVRFDSDKLDKDDVGNQDRPKGDLLENVSLAEEERRVRAIEESKPHKPAYEELTGANTVLPQYDERPAAPVYTIGQLTQKQTALGASSGGSPSLPIVSLDSSSKIASDYYTSEEIAKFRKPKKTSAMAARRKKIKVKEEPPSPTTEKTPPPAPSKSSSTKAERDAEIAAAVAGVHSSSRDHGSHRKRSEQALRAIREDERIEQEERDKAYARAVNKAEQEAKIKLQYNMLLSESRDKGDVGMTQGVEEGEELEKGGEKDDDVVEDDGDLFESIMRARQLKFTESKKLPRSETDIVDRVGIKVESESVPANSLTSDLVLTQIGEFCRSLPASAVKPEEPAAEEVPSTTQTTATATTTTTTSTTTTSSSEIPKTSVQEPVVVKKEEEPDTEKPQDLQSRWKTVVDGGEQEFEEVKEESSSEEENEANPLEDEPLVSSGVGATIRMLQRRGVVADEHDLVNYAGRAKDHVLTLTKTDDPAPNIRLEYTDEFGRVLTPKEAFRRLSYKFHGKCPGKNKLDKALRKYQEELARKRSSSTDTPLASVDAMRRVQRASHQPHIVLSGPGMKDQLPLGVAIEAQDSAAADAAAAAASASAAGAGKKRKKITIVQSTKKKKSRI